MEVTISKTEEKAVAAVSGRLDTVSSAELKQKLDEAGIAGLDLELDFTEVEYVSSAGLRLLVLLQRQALGTGHTMVIRNINNVIREIFRISGFNKAFTVV